MLYRRVWLIVVIVSLFHLFGAAAFKYGLASWFPKRVSEITIELGGSVAAGSGGQGMAQPTPTPTPTQTPPKPIAPTKPPPVRSDEPGLKQQRESPSLPPATPMPVTSGPNGPSGVAGADAAPTLDADYKAAYLNNPKPPYPPMAFQMRIEGTVMLKAHVQPDGSCGEVLLARSSGNELLDRSAMNTVAQWKFVPAKAQGKDIAQWVSIPITFSIKRR